MNKIVVIRKVDKSKTLVLMAKDYYYNTLVMKNHLYTSAYQKIDSNSDKLVFNNLNFLINKTKILFNKH